MKGIFTDGPPLPPPPIPQCVLSKWTGYKMGRPGESWWLGTQAVLNPDLATYWPRDLGQVPA